MKTRPSGLAALALALPLLPAAAHALASPWAEHSQVRARLLTARAVAVPGETLLAGVEFRLAPGWHAYWKNSGDAGFAPRFDFSRSAGVALAEGLWPAPRRFQIPGGLQALGYEGEVIYPVRLALAGSGAASGVTLRADLDYVVCAEECVPYRDRLELDQPLAAAAADDPPVAGPLDAALARVPAAAASTRLRPRAALRREAGGGLELELLLQGARPGAAGADLFLDASDTFDAGQPAVATSPAGLRFTVPLSLKRADQPPPETLDVAWTATGLADPAPAAVSGSSTAALTAPVATRPWMLVLPLLLVVLVFLWLARARARAAASPHPS